MSRLDSFIRRLEAQRACLDRAAELILGDLRETLKAARDWLGGRVACAHFDVGTGDAAANLTLAAELAPRIVPLLCAGAVLVSDPAIDCPELETLPLPDGIAAGRYHLYRRL